MSTLLRIHPAQGDARGAHLARAAATWLGLDTWRVEFADLFALDGLSPEVAERFAREALMDPVLHRLEVGSRLDAPWAASFLVERKRGGVTDDRAAVTRRTLDDWAGAPQNAEVQTATLILLERPLSPAQLAQIAEALLGNPLLHLHEGGAWQGHIPEIEAQREPQTPPSQAEISLDLLDDDGLLALSRRRVLALDLAELGALRDHYRETRAARAEAGRSQHPTELELEVFAQTWSEHCKHKEMSALVTYRDEARGEVREIDSLFETYIRATTTQIRARLEAAGHRWLVSVFDDNAGVVALNAAQALVWKVETHNSPSALDPYGGAMTGLLGVQRDPSGTGRGGAVPLFHTDVLCFGPPDYDAPLLPGQLHPRRVMEGVVAGIADAGNKTGVPTVNGAIRFDPRYSGKPLVFCGAGALLPLTAAGRATAVKEIAVGDRIVMIGGRVGRDGIHGATFSSEAVGEHSPRAAVQIGSPFTQKRMLDFLADAAALGWVRSSTDNGAGGLASSIGELARYTSGAVVHLERVPLKYPGLAPWEIFVSESQERMTLAVDPARLDALLALAVRWEVEATDIGAFTGDGALEVFHIGELYGWFDLDFLHNGLPRKRMEAVGLAPRGAPVAPPEVPFGEALLSLLSSHNLASPEDVLRRYDHEVKARTVIKPLMGRRQRAPQDAAVLRLDLEGWAGLAVSNGLAPQYGDLDAYAAGMAAVDEAVRQILAVGGRLPDPQDPACPPWSLNDNLAVPNSAYHPVHNPDGREKLGAVVQMLEGMAEVALAYGVPLTSGKDSMKNDFVAGAQKISVPPTLLISAVAGLADVRAARSAELKRPGDRVALLGHTRDEMGASAFFALLGERGGVAPRVRAAEHRPLYLRLGRAGALLASAHDLSEGGLAVALAEAAWGGGVGADVDLASVHPDPAVALFSESTGRLLVSYHPDNEGAVTALFGGDLVPLGVVTEAPLCAARHGSTALFSIPICQLEGAWAREVSPCAP